MTPPAKLRDIRLMEIVVYILILLPKDMEQMSHSYSGQYSTLWPWQPEFESQM